MVVLDSDFQTISIFDAQDRKLRYRTALTSSPGGRHTFRVSQDKLLLWAGNKMYRIDPSTGTTLSTESVPWNNECSFEQEADRCAIVCKCGIQIVDCATGKRLGSEFEKTFVHIHESGVGDEAPTANSGCFGSGVDMLTTVPGIALLSIEDHEKPIKGIFSRPLIYIGADTKTGKERWRNRQITPNGAYGRQSGASSDGRSCFIAHEPGDIFVLDCQTGALRWKRPGKSSDSDSLLDRVFTAAVPQDKLFQRLDEKAIMMDIHTGKVRWQISLPKTTFALPSGIPIPPYTLNNTDKTISKSLWILDTQTGAALSKIEMPPMTYTYPDPSGGFYVMTGSGQLTAYEADGRQRVRIEQADPSNLMVRSDFVALFDSNRMVLLDRSDLHTVAVLDGQFDTKAESSLAHGVLLYRFIDNGRKIGEAVLLRRRTPRP